MADSRDPGRGLSSVACALLLAAWSCRGGEDRSSSPPSSEPPAPVATLRAPAAPAPSPRAPVRKVDPPSPAPSGPAPSAPASPMPTPLPPAPEARPAVDAARVTRLVLDGETALAADRLPEAASLFREALALDPGDARALRGRARTATASLGLTRTFVPDLSSADGAEGRVREMEGFDVDDVDVRQAARIPGRAELEAQPRRVKPGDTFTVKVYLRNQSKKKKRVIKIGGLEVRQIVNGVEARLPTSLLQREVAPKERVLVANLTGPWADDVSSFTLDVRVSSEAGDTYQNRLFWK